MDLMRSWLSDWAVKWKFAAVRNSKELLGKPDILNRKLDNRNRSSMDAGRWQPTTTKTWQTETLADYNRLRFLCSRSSSRFSFMDANGTLPKEVHSA